jgi:hypothetical protein
MSEREPSGGAMAWITFAGVVMIIGGGFSILQGLGWLINSNQFPIKDSVFSANATTWGWVQLLLGVVVLLSGFAVFSGNVLARTVGVIVVGLNMLTSFVSIDLHPVWGICVIAIDLAIIWALTAHGRDIQRAREMGMS